MGKKRRKRKTQHSADDPQGRPVTDIKAETKAETPERKPTEQTGATERAKQTEWPKWSAIAAMAMFAVNIAALIAYSFVNVNQLRLTRESTEHAYRAWLTVKEGKGLAVFPKQHAVVDVDVENTGRSPARNVRVRWSATIQAPDWIAPGNALGNIFGIGVIGPGQSRAIPFKTTQMLGDDDIAGLVSRRTRLFFVAELIYEDQFGANRLLQLCMFYDPPPKTGPVHGIPQCGAHNAVR